MALANVGFTMNVQLVDSGNNKSSLRYAMDTSIVVDHAGALAAAALIIVDINAISGAFITAYSVDTVFRDSAIVLPADEEVEDKASISFTMDNGKVGNLRVPAPMPLVFQGTTTEERNQVDLGVNLVTDYVANFLAAGPLFVSETNKLVQTVRGKRIHVKNSNG
jgi:hypothetical protein